jgi:hypothetical protein
VKIGGIDRNKRNKYVQLAMEDKDIWVLNSPWMRAPEGRSIGCVVQIQQAQVNDMMSVVVC